MSHYFSHLWFPVVTPCFVLSLTQYISITFISLLFSNLLSLCETQWITKKRQFWYGLCSLALQQETVAFEQSHKDPEIHKLDHGRKKKNLIDLWRYYNIFRWKRLSIGPHTPVTTTAPFIVTRHPPVILLWQRPSVQLRPHDVPQPEWRKKANQMKKAHVTRQVRGERQRERLSWVLLVESVFPTKFLSNHYSLLTSGMFHIQKVSSLPCQFPQCSKGRHRLTDKECRVRLSDRWCLGPS